MLRREIAAMGILARMGRIVDIRAVGESISR
jgi:hypothetical protein